MSVELFDDAGKPSCRFRVTFNASQGFLTATEYAGKRFVFEDGRESKSLWPIDAETGEKLPPLLPSDFLVTVNKDAAGHAGVSS